MEKEQETRLVHHRWVRLVMKGTCATALAEDGPTCLNCPLRAVAASLPPEAAVSKYGLLICCKPTIGPARRLCEVASPLLRVEFSRTEFDALSPCTLQVAMIGG